jgi:hypothetical protein
MKVYQIRAWYEDIYTHYRTVGPVFRSPEALRQWIAENGDKEVWPNHVRDLVTQEEAQAQARASHEKFCEENPDMSDAYIEREFLDLVTGGYPVYEIEELEVVG